MPIQLHTAPAPETTPAASTAETRAFYEALFGLDCAMDTGWLVTLEPGCAPLAQCGDDGDGAGGLPELTIEVADIDAVRIRARVLGARILRNPWAEGHGQRRFFLQDPEGRLVNVTEEALTDSQAA
ncbi:VOC family protein [Marinibacterium sp. SX1]|uniref:VOC family protein n=1 Tax=Marinibacterium sp. SX1 TaxID=3388424 RepID=UPI003D186C45